MTSTKAAATVIGSRQASAVTVDGGRCQVRRSLLTTRSVSVVWSVEYMSLQRLLTISHRIKAIKNCSGIKVTGRRYARVVMTERQQQRTAVLDANCHTYLKVGG